MPCSTWGSCTWWNSNKPTKLKTELLGRLTRDAHLHEFLVLRYKGSDFATRRQDIVRYALMSPGLIRVGTMSSEQFPPTFVGDQKEPAILSESSLQRVCAGVLWHHRGRIWCRSTWMCEKVRTNSSCLRTWQSMIALIGSP